MPSYYVMHRCSTSTCRLQTQSNCHTKSIPPDELQLSSMERQRRRFFVAIGQTEMAKSLNIQMGEKLALIQPHKATAACSEPGTHGINRTSCLL